MLYLVKSAFTKFAAYTTPITLTIKFANPSLATEYCSTVVLTISCSALLALFHVIITDLD